MFAQFTEGTQAFIMRMVTLHPEMTVLGCDLESFGMATCGIPVGPLCLQPAAP